MWVVLGLDQARTFELAFGGGVQRPLLEVAGRVRGGRARGEQHVCLVGGQRVVVEPCRVVTGAEWLPTRSHGRQLKIRSVQAALSDAFGLSAATLLVVSGRAEYMWPTGLWRATVGAEEKPRSPR
jgi:hypothetical protein